MTTTYPIVRFLLDTGDLEYSRSQVVSAKLIEQNNILSTEIPINTLELKIKSLDDTFSMFSDSFALLTEKLPLLVYENIDGVTNLLGKFYLNTWKNPSERILEFTATDIISVLNDTDFDGVFFADPITLTAAFAQIFAPINVTYEIESTLADVEISGYIPAGTYREALQQMCFAARATVVTARRESLLITPSVLPEFFYSSRIRNNTRIGKPSIELLPLISTIELVSHNYTEGPDIETIFDEYLEAGSYKIIFEKPYYSVVISGPGYTQTVLGTEGGDYIGTENGDYIEAGGEYNLGSNSVYLTISEAGQVTVTGYPWIDSKRSFIFNETGTADARNKNTITISDATLISTTNGQAVLDNVRDFYRQRYLQKIKLLPTDLQTNNIALSESLYNTKILANVEQMNINLTGGFLSDVTMRGIAPAYAPPIENPVRRVRAGIAISGAGLTRNNKWRQYA